LPATLSPAIPCQILTNAVIGKWEVNRERGRFTDESQQTHQPKKKAGRLCPACESENGWGANFELTTFGL